MVKRSLGKMSKRTRLLGMCAKRMTAATLVRKYEIGNSVSITPQSRYCGMPHPRYRGLCGEIVKKRGNAYVVEVQVGNALKTLIIPPVHLQLKQ
jgi:large subunit ribosomal protein L21e